MSLSGDVCGCYLCASYIDNWPSGTDEAEQQLLINKVEQLIDKVTENKWCPTAFDMELNGNGKNRLFIPVPYDILSVSAWYIDCILMDLDWIAFDENSIYLNPCASGSYPLSPELYYRIRESMEEGLFPRGYNNIRVVGTYGESSVPQPVIQAATMYAKWELDPTLYTFMGLKKSERIGRYAYTNIAGDMLEILTGVMEVDLILKHYIKGKSIIMAP